MCCESLNVLAAEESPPAVEWVQPRIEGTIGDAPPEEEIAHAEPTCRLIHRDKFIDHFATPPG